jgi:CBS domain-containing protein
MDAADIMTTDVVTVDPEMEVSKVAATLLAHRISGAPVVDDKGCPQECLL